MQRKRQSTALNPGGEGGWKRVAFARGGGDADVFGADAGGEFLGRAKAKQFVAQIEGVGREQGGRDGDAEFVAADKRAEVFGFAFCDRDDRAGVGEESAEVDAGGGERLFVGFVGNGEVVSKKDHASGVGVGKVDRAGVVKRHGRIFGLGFGKFDLIVRYE